RARGAMSFIGLSLPKRIPNHTGKVGNSTQVSGTSDASKTQLGLIGTYFAGSTDFSKVHGG
ncbi:MAG TPA: hypothetical protein VEI73_16485, partial [Candidatus Acidoferrum sp.]|nr:hypothetical protein [Candidatus Acidoferrum sp.]